MSQEILDKVLDLFAKVSSMPTIIYPDPKYEDIDLQIPERAKMMKAGADAILPTFSLLGKTCYLGHYEKFLVCIKILKISEFNDYFESESVWSLLHFVMFGRKKLAGDNPKGYEGLETMELQYAGTDNFWKVEHIKIAQYLLDHGLYIDIQSRWGYTSLYESVINTPDLKFAEFLLQHGADPNFRNIFDEVPLIDAIKGSNVESVELLCRYDANPQQICAFKYKLTPLYLGRSHIEIATILNNTINKSRNNTQLECENTRYCFVCNVTSKKKKLFRCRRCKGYQKYCSVKCQKRDWNKHKKECIKDQHKIFTTKDISQKELIFDIESAQGRTEPQMLLRTDASEAATEKLWNEAGGSKLFPHKSALEQHRKKYKKKRNIKINKELKKQETLHQNKVKMNYKFIVKVQIQRVRETVRHPLLKNVFNKTLVYNKSRNYMVFINYKNQELKYRKLEKIVKQYGFSLNDSYKHQQSESRKLVETTEQYGFKLNSEKEGCKGYFYGWVDSRHRLHILTDKVLALQPW